MFKPLSGFEQLELSTQLLIQEAKNRGVKVEVLDWSDNFIRLSRQGNVQYVKQATKTAVDNYAAILLMENKEVTKKVLAEHGMRVPHGEAVTSIEQGLSVDLPLYTEAIVVKPKSTNFGQGVAILKPPYDEQGYRQALAAAFTHDTSVLVEEFIEGKEYRILVIGDEVAAVLNRVPANVQGDGQRTIEQLVRAKNEDPLRGTGYVTPLEKIRLGEEEKQYLKWQGLDFHSVPAKDEIVYLRENTNISTGGDSIDYTDELHEGYKKIAVEAARAAGVHITGIDMIIKDIGIAPTDNNYSIIELNFNPALHIHDYPYKGLNRRVEGKVLDLLGYE